MSSFPQPDLAPSALSPAMVSWSQRAFMLRQYGFRLFFLLMGLVAISSVAVWMAGLASGFWPKEAIAAAHWHGHEMLFGFAMAAVAGFLLTAVPNWAGTVRTHGLPLTVLAGLWLGGRLGLLPGLGLAGAGITGGLAALVDLAFIPALMAVLAPALIRAGGRRHGIFLGLLAGLCLANLLIHAEWLGLLDNGVRRGFLLAVNMLVVMVAVVAGRIVPAFTQNALRQQGQLWEIPARPRLEQAVVLSLLAMAGVELVAPDTAAVGAAATLVAGLTAWRLRSWRTGQTFRQPILWILHLGAGWIPLALGFKALALLTGAAFTASWLHAITIGVIATLILGVATRVALGHTGRPLRVSPPVTAAYLLLTAAALVRISAPLRADPTPMLLLAGGLWITVFGLFVWEYFTILTTPRPDGKPG